MNLQHFSGVFIVFSYITNLSPCILCPNITKRNHSSLSIQRSARPCVSCVCQDNFNLMTFAAVGSICFSRKTNVLFFFKYETCCILVPQDYNDEIRQEQLRELSLLNGSEESSRGRIAPGRSARPATTVSTR